MVSQKVTFSFTLSILLIFLSKLAIFYFWPLSALRCSLTTAKTTFVYYEMRFLVAA
jgi:hypothetical protein